MDSRRNVCNARNIFWAVSVRCCATRRMGRLILCVWQRSWCWLHHFSCLVVIITCLATRTERKHIYSGVKSRIASLHPVLVMSNGFLLLFWHNDRCQYGKWIQLHLQVSPRKSFRPVHHCIVSSSTVILMHFRSILTFPFENPFQSPT